MDDLTVKSDGVIEGRIRLWIEQNVPFTDTFNQQDVSRVAAEADAALELGMGSGAAVEAIRAFVGQVFTQRGQKVEASRPTVSSLNCPSCIKPAVQIVGAGFIEEVEYLGHPYELHGRATRLDCSACSFTFYTFDPTW